MFLENFISTCHDNIRRIKRVCDRDISRYTENLNEANKEYSLLHSTKEKLKDCINRPGKKKCSDGSFCCIRN